MRLSSRAAPLVACLGLLTIAAWLVLLRWFALLDHLATPHTAIFDFFRGSVGYGSGVLTGMTLLFLALHTLYAATYWLLRRAPVFAPSLTWIVVALALVTGLVNVLLYPIGVFDLFYYLAQLKLVVVYHQNPYATTFLTVAAGDPLARLSPLLDVPSIYGPAWLLIAALPVTLVGFGDLARLVVAYKLFSLGCLLLSGCFIYAGRRNAGGNSREGWLGVYLWLGNPLIVFEAVANAHNDVVLTALLLLAVVALDRRARWSGPLLVLAALVKVTVLPLLPVVGVALARRRWPARRIATTALLGLLVGLVVVAPFWAGGRLAPGMARAIEAARGLSAMTPFALYRTWLQERGQAGGSRALTTLWVGSVALYLPLWRLVLWRVRRLEWALAAILVLTHTLIVGSLQPWHLLPVLGLLALRHDAAGARFVLLLSGLAFFLYPLTIWLHLVVRLTALQAHLCLFLAFHLPALAYLLRWWWRARAGRAAPPTAPAAT